MERGRAEDAECMSEPSTLRQIAFAVVLLIVDLAVIAWFLWSYAWIGWGMAGTRKMCRRPRGLRGVRCGSWLGQRW